MAHTVIQVPAIIDIADEDKTQWVATGVPSTQFEGLFAFGDDFHTARQAFAELVAAALASGSIAIAGVDWNDIAAVRVMATTRKTFTVDQLTEQP